MSAIMEHNIFGIINIKKHNIAEGSCLVTNVRSLYYYTGSGITGLYEKCSNLFKSSKA